MFFFKKFKTISTNEECLNKILSIFLDHENEMLTGKYNLCLTVEFLMFFDDLNRNLNNEICEEKFKEKFESKVNKLVSSFKNLNLLKITGNLRESFKLKFDLKYFASLKNLELENVYLDNILSLNEITNQLTTFKLNRCLTNKTFDEIFYRETWQSLINLSISRTVFKSDEFNFVPISTQNLQLQWNQITQFKLNSSSRYNLTELDLSYNKLKAIPYFDEKELICSSLKVLKLKGNLIDSLKNVENFKKLEQLDISLNLICNKDDITRYLSSCKKLRVLNLIDNPVQMKENLSIFILEVFPALAKLNNQQCYKDSLNDRELMESDQSIPFNDLEKVKNATDKNDSSGSSYQKTKKKDRIVVILDRTNSFSNQTDDEQSDQDRLSSVNGSTKGVSLGLESNLSDLNEIIAKQRESLGKKFLSDKTTNLVVPFSTPVDCNNYSIIGEMQKLDQQQQSSTPVFDLQIEQVKEKMNDLVNEQNAILLKDDLTPKDEHVVILNSNTNDISKENDQDAKQIKDNDSANSITSLSLSPKEEDNEWANEDINGDNIFLVNKLDANLVENKEPIFILVKDSLIYEKDCTTGKIFEVYDLNVITNYELENSSTISLVFDSKVKSKQKVTYNLELDSQLDKFKTQFIDPFVERNKEEKQNQRFKYECLKCETKNESQTKCSNCKSTALIESTNYLRQTSSSIDRQSYVTQSSFKEDFLNQVKIKLTSEVISNRDQQIIDKLVEENNDELNKAEEKESKTDSNCSDKKEEKEEEVKDEDNPEMVNKLIESKLENYELDQFTSIDHELKLYLDVKIFSSNERLHYLFECDFSINDTSGMNHGRVVVTNTSLHLVSLKSENKQLDDLQNEDNLDRTFNIFTMPLNKIKNIKLGRDYFFHQCVWLTVERLCGKKKKKKHLVETQTFFLILRDKYLADVFSEYLESYLNQQEIKLKVNVNQYNLTEKPVNLDTEENIIFCQFIVSLTTKSDLEISRSSCDDLLCLLFDKAAGLILARCEVIANELKFKKIVANDLSNLICAKIEPNDCKKLHLYFSNNANTSKLEWIVGSYSVRSMSKIIDLVRTLWQNIYKIDLQIFIE